MNRCESRNLYIMIERKCILFIFYPNIIVNCIIIIGIIMIFVK